MSTHQKILVFYSSTSDDFPLSKCKNLLNYNPLWLNSTNVSKFDAPQNKNIYFSLYFNRKRSRVFFLFQNIFIEVLSCSFSVSLCRQFQLSKRIQHHKFTLTEMLPFIFAMYEQIVSIRFYNNFPLAKQKSNIFSALFNAYYCSI